MPKKRKLVWYHPDLKEQARELRNNCTETEYLLWQRLKGKQMKGYDFHRQRPILYYIIDFYCTNLKLAIEIDGSVHNEEEIQLRDNKRQEQLKDYGIKFLRFKNDEVLFHIESVVARIEEWIVAYEIIHTPPTPSS
jgi:very-short-patch-repair endonuclease